jgi:hypothetical protein
MQNNPYLLKEREESVTHLRDSLVFFPLMRFLQKMWEHKNNTHRNKAGNVRIT